MKRIYILTLLATIAYMANGQTVVVKDKETGQPIEQAVFLSDSLKATALTNAEGQVAFKLFKGARNIEIRRLGYKAEVKSFDEIARGQYVVQLMPNRVLADIIVVSATRFRQSERRVPGKISLIKAADMALQNPQTAADLLGISGEVFIQKSQQGGGSPMIRGFATNRLLYTVDGVRMNSAIFRAGNLQNVISLDPFAMASTEVLFGPSSVIYGSDAIGGVMSFQTLKPQLSKSDETLIAGQATSRFSSANNEQTYHFDVNVGGKKWASVTSLTHNKYGDLEMGAKGPDAYLKRYTVQRINNADQVVENPNPLVQAPSGYSQFNLMQKIRLSPNENWDFEYAFHYSETSPYSRYDRLLELQDNGLPASAVWNYGPQKWMMSQVTASYSQQTDLFDQVTARLAQQRFVESRIDRRFNHHRLRNNLEEVQAYSVNVDFQKSLAKHQFYYGLEYVQNDVDSKGSAVDIRSNTPMAVPDRYPKSTWSSYAAYFNYQYIFSNQLLLQAGARYNHFRVNSDFTRHLEFFPFDFTKSELQNGATTGSLGLVFTPDDSWKISANASSGFRAPNVDDIGKIFDFSDGEVVVPNTNLKAEYAYNGELGISKIFGDRVKLDVTGFYTYLDNAMVRRPFSVNGQATIDYNGQPSDVYAIQNAAYAKIYGFNAGVEIALSANFELSSRYNYQYGKEEMDNGKISRSRHAAPAFGVTRLTFKKKSIQLQIYSMYSAQVGYANLNDEERQKPVIYLEDANGNPYSPRWYTLNFKSLYSIHPNFTVSGGVENLTNQRYRPYSSGLVAPGRNFIISLTAKW